jgi:hypothetical protein
MKTSVISICTLKHANVWKLTAEALPRFIDATDFTVYVPESERNTFEKITNSRISVRSQEDLNDEFRSVLNVAVSRAENESRFGWYNQQFLKIEALISCPSERAVIWDSDCVPLCKINLFDSQGKAKYIKAYEYNKSYFDLIEKLLGIERSYPYSFVIPGFPTYTSWIREMVDELENNIEKKRWFQYLIENIDFSLKSGFSEFETMGTWIAENYSNEIVNSAYLWERSGQSRFGYAKKFHLDELIQLANEENSIDLVSFENWDLRGMRLFYSKLVSKTSEIAFRLAKRNVN